MGDEETAKNLQSVEAVQVPQPPSIQSPTPQKPQNWVKFDEEQPVNNESDSAAVINTESVQVNIERSLNRSTESNNVAVFDPKPLRNVELPIATVEPIRQGFCK